MGQPEAYMLPRGTSESQRLDAQHLWMKTISYDKLIHESIPVRPARAVADVATGTGAWLRDLISSWASVGGEEKVEFVGFDISSNQFPQTDIPNLRFHVHDATQPFPPEYREKFDIVNVRMVTYAMKTGDLDKVVQNIADILRPGGYLQWQEFDPNDTWTRPETQTSRDVISAIMAERKARGLFPALVSPLIKAIESTSAPVPEGKINDLTRTEQLLRVMQLQSIRTEDHPQAFAREYTTENIFKATVFMLRSGVERRKGLEGTSWPESTQDRFMDQYVTESEAKIKSGNNDPGWIWNVEVAWIVARKAIFVSKNGEWWTPRYDTAG